MIFLLQTTAILVYNILPKQRKVLILLTRVAPSLLSADFSKLGEEIRSVKEAGADWLHYDVMDGHFVPNISMGIPVLKSVRSCTDMFLDVHLMITEPVRYVRQFCEAGADLVNVHVEADEQENLFEALAAVRSCGRMTGITLKPKTPWQAVFPFLEQIDLILVMTVEPGFGGQKFMHEQLEKVRALRELVDHSERKIFIETDGGVDAVTGKLCVEAGADVLVAGSAVFNAADRADTIRRIRAELS